MLNIQRQPGANVIETVDDIKAALPELESSLPDSVKVQVLTDRTTGIRASVHDVEFELMLAVALVVLVIFLFLRSVPATFIASVAAPISLVGTFAVMYLLGFSLNNLTLMALTISTGFVVDDAIVMIENISRYIEEGKKPMDAALQGRGRNRLHHYLPDRLPDRGADPAVVHGRRGRATVSRVRHHLGGDDRHLGRRVADPCAHLVGPLASSSRRQTGTRQSAWATGSPPGAGSRQCSIARYDRALTWVLDHQKATLLVAVATFVLTAVLYLVIPKGLFPTQDTGLLQAYTVAGQSVSFGEMSQPAGKAGAIACSRIPTSRA